MRTGVSKLLSSALVVAVGATAIAWRRYQQRQERRRILAAEARGQPTRHIVVVGVGFAGLAAVNRLGDLVGDDPRFDVLLLDRQNYHLFTPLLYQVASGGVEPGTVTYPARQIVRKYGFRFKEAAVQGVDLERKCLDTDVGPISFDSLILAPGSVTNYFGMADAEEHSLPLKSVNDGSRVHNQVINAFELADRELDRDRRRALLTFVIVGGGATGVELSASLSDLIFTTLLPDYPGINAEDVRLMLVEARGTLLPGWNPRMGEVALEHLLTHHVQVLLSTTVAHVTDHDVELSSGERIPTCTVIWTAGVRAEPLTYQLPGDKERDGRIRVDANLELPGYPGIFVVGDAAAVILPGSERPMPPTAWAAIGQGGAAAENAIRRLEGQVPRPFFMRRPGDLVSLGRAAAAADLFGVVFDDLPGWLIRRLVYLTNLVGFRNRLLVALQWLLVSFHQRMIASFETICPPRPTIAAPTQLRAPVRRARAASPSPRGQERRAG